MDLAALLSSMPSSDVVFFESYGLIFPKQLYVSGPRSDTGPRITTHNDLLASYECSEVLSIKFSCTHMNRMNVSGSELGQIYCS